MPYDPGNPPSPVHPTQGYHDRQQGAYFVTICTHERQCVLGEVEGGEAILGEIGQIVQEEWRSLVERFTGIGLGAFVAMPSHVHRGLVIIRTTGAGWAAVRGDRAHL